MQRRGESRWQSCDEEQSRVETDAVGIKKVRWMDGQREGWEGLHVSRTLWCDKVSH